jgi:hypothetical protein
MPWAATDALDDARKATQSLLLPFDAGRWLRLAVIAFFIGGFGSAGGGGGGNAGAPPPGTGGGSLPDVGPLPGFSRIVTLVLIAVAVLVALGLLFALVGAVMEFVLIEGLRTRDVRIRGPFREYFRRGLRLFGFRVAIFLVPLLLVGAPVVVAGLLGFGNVFSLVALLIPLFVLALPLFLLALLVDRLTTDFVVPAMLVDGTGVLDGWRRLWPEFRGEWREFLLYVVVRFVLAVVAAVAVGLVLVLCLAVVAIPFVLLGGLVAVAGVGGTPFVVAVAVLGVAFLVVAVAVVAVVQVPVVTYFRYYALYVLGRVVPDLDLVGVPDDDADGPATAGDDGDGGDADAPTDSDGGEGDAEAAGPARDDGSPGGDSPGDDGDGERDRR